MDNKLYYSGFKAAKNGGKSAGIGESNPDSGLGLSYYVRKVNIFSFAYDEQGPFQTYDQARRLLESVAEQTGNRITRNFDGEEVVLFHDSVLSVISKATGTI